MKTILFSAMIAAALILTSVSTANAAQSFALKRYILNHLDDIPSDTAVTGIHPRGMLTIENGRVSMYVQACLPGGETCGDIIPFYQNTPILAASEHVAIMGDGTEVNILQVSPQLIISMHVPFVGTDIFFFQAQ